MFIDVSPAEAGLWRLPQGLWPLMVSVLLGSFFASPGWAHEAEGLAAATTPVAAEAPQELVVRGHTALADRNDHSASEGTVYFRQLRRRPLARTAELLEFVPGLLATQHAGGGKANQYFLRGFNLDHGSDFAVWLDGVPLNLPSHGHGQGYTDLNPLIPELIDKLDFQKGVYWAHAGDFSSAGAAYLHQARELPAPLGIVEVGAFGRRRGVGAQSLSGRFGRVMGALEILQNDGPWERGDGFTRVNALLSAETDVGAHTVRIAARGYRGSWNSSDQVAESAVSTGFIGRFGSLDASTGGEASRYSLQLDWRRRTDHGLSEATLYGVATGMDLFSNFTYFLTDPVKGDQFEQVDERQTWGGWLRHTTRGSILGRSAQLAVGLQGRVDAIDNGLYQTQQRARTAKTAMDGSALAATTREDSILQSSAGIWAESQVQLAPAWLAVVGLRGDAMYFDVQSDRGENTGQRAAGAMSPKLTFRWTPANWLQLFLQAGLGFHSNDARGVLTQRDPVTGQGVTSADPLVRTRGAELGLRTEAGTRLQSSLALWWLDADSELVFVGDAGTTEAGRPSTRIGVEWLHHLHLWESLRAEADFSWSFAEFRDNPRDPDSGELVGREIPGAVKGVIAAAVRWQPTAGPQAGLRLRWFGPRPLVEDGTLQADATALLSAHVGWRWPAGWQVLATGWNLLARDDADIAYAYESRVSPTNTALVQRHIHPVEPLHMRLEISKGW